MVNKNSRTMESMMFLSWGYLFNAGYFYMPSKQNKIYRHPPKLFM